MKENTTTETPQTKSIDPFIHRKVVVLREDQSAYQAARAMCDNHIGCVVVVDAKGFMVGLLTDRDITCGLASTERALEDSISEFMTRGLIKADESTSVSGIIALMKKGGVRRIPIVKSVQKGEKCVGFVSLDDLLASQRISSADVAEITKSQIRRRERRNRQAQPTSPSQEAEHARTFKRLISSVAEKSDLDHSKAELLIDTVLTLVVRRLNFTVAGRLIELLPHRLQQRLLDLPAGPDLFITPDLIREAVSEKFETDLPGGDRLIGNLWAAISETSDPMRLNLIAEQFPDEIRLLLTTLSPGRGQTRSHEPLTL